VNLPCRHFGVCGGCAHQDKPEEDYRAVKRALVIEALSRHGIAAEILDLVVVPPGSRRRATVKALKGAVGVTLGFHAAKSHDIVDMQECPVLTPHLAALIPGLRDMLAALLRSGEEAELKLTDTPAGIDLSLRWQRDNDADTLTALAHWADRLKLARVSRHGETLIELAKPYVRIGHVDVPLPSEAFLQPTEVGQVALQHFVCESLAKAKKIVDLFSGCGTFALALAEHGRVHAVELEADHLEALAVAAKSPGLKPVTTEKRNLFKRPLGEGELEGFDGMCLDPPRAGAFDQVKILAKSKVKRVVYVSCDADSFARDAAVLIGGGYSLMRVQPVDQFLWSNHIELAAKFLRM
jgi:23S rRNA (uracil1939-C5)-methyltransferase